MAIKKRFFKSKKSKKKSDVLSPGLCALCGKESDDKYLGQLFVTPEIVVHENCLLFSPLLHQIINPDKERDGFIIGFKIADVEREIRRIKPLRCCICHNNRAGVGCCNSVCRKSFHLCCGMAQGAVGIFKDNFQFFCNDHSPPQNVKTYLKQCERVVPECTVCLDSLVEDGYEEISAGSQSGNMWTQFLAKVKKNSVIHGQCCARSWMHRVCMSQYGLSAGLHHAKCPHCSDKTKFIDAVQQCGIWLPDRDASWELEPGAFHELYDDPPTNGIVQECVSNNEVTTATVPVDTHPSTHSIATGPVDTHTSAHSIATGPVDTHTLKTQPSPSTRKRARPSDWSTKSSPAKPAKRRRPRSKGDSKEGVLIRRTCARCNKDIVSLNCKKIVTRNQISVLKEANLNQGSAESDSEYVCVSCHK